MKLRKRNAWLYRKCRLVNINSERVISARSILEFCRKAKLSKHEAKYAVVSVLNNVRMSYKGWYLPETLNHTLEFNDVYGNEYSAKIGELISGKKMGKTSINKLMNGHGLCRGLHPVGAKMHPAVIPLQSQVIDEYQVKCNNRIFTGTTLAEVAFKAGISTTSVRHLVHGYSKKISGVQLHNVTTKPRQIISL